MTRMCLFLAIAGLLAAPAVAQAQNGADHEDSRFSFHRIDGGYLRLDGRSGQVAKCARSPAGWLCQAVPDERAALEAEISRLQGENVSLKKELLANNLSLPNGVRPEPPPLEPSRLQLPSDAELNRIMTFIEKVWRRMVEMIVATQKDMMKRS
jgi:hypothetical protein